MAATSRSTARASWSPIPSSSCAIRSTCAATSARLEAAIIETAAAFGVTAGRIEGLTGVWVEGERKLAAIGVRVKRGVTTHGLALNVNTDAALVRRDDPVRHPRQGGHLPGPRARPPGADGGGRGCSWPPRWPRAFGLRLADGAPGVVGPAGGRRAMSDRDDPIVERAATARTDHGPDRGRRLRAVGDERLPGLGRAARPMRSSSTPAWAPPRQPGRARRGQRAAPAPHRQLARPHRPHLRQRPAEARRPARRSPSIRTTRIGWTAATTTASRSSASTAERDLREGDAGRASATLSSHVLHTPGHTEGSVCLYERGAPAAPRRRRALRRLRRAGPICPAATTRRWSRRSPAWPPRPAAEVRVLPGHGPETTIGRELPWLRAHRRRRALLVAPAEELPAPSRYG